MLFAPQGCQFFLYRPEPLVADGLFHQVEVRVKGHKELIVRARNGYYAPKK